MKRTDTQRGQTLLEVLLSIAVAGGVALAVFSLFQLIDGMRTRQTEAADVAWESDWTMQQLSGLAEGGVVAPGPHEEASAVSFSDGTQVTLEDGRLIVHGPSGSPEALTSGRVTVSSLSFSDDGDTLPDGPLRISFSMAASGSQDDTTHTYTTSIYAR